MIDLIQNLLILGYTVTFEGSSAGDFFCLLRRVETMGLAHCAIGDTPEGAASAAADWAESGEPGNGTAARAERKSFTVPERVSALEFAAEAIVMRIDGLEERLRQCETGPVDGDRVFLTIDGGPIS